MNKFVQKLRKCFGAGTAGTVKKDKEKDKEKGPPQDKKKAEKSCPAPGPGAPVERDGSSTKPLDRQVDSTEPPKVRKACAESLATREAPAAQPSVSQDVSPAASLQTPGGREGSTESLPTEPEKEASTPSPSLKVVTKMHSGPGVGTASTTGASCAPRLGPEPASSVVTSPLNALSGDDKVEDEMVKALGMMNIGPDSSINETEDGRSAQSTDLGKHYISRGPKRPETTTTAPVDKEKNRLSPVEKDELWRKYFAEFKDVCDPNKSKASGKLSYRSRGLVGGPGGPPGFQGQQEFQGARGAQVCSFMDVDSLVTESSEPPSADELLRCDPMPYEDILDSLENIGCFLSGLDDNGPLPELMPELLHDALQDAMDSDSQSDRCDTSSGVSSGEDSSSPLPESLINDFLKKKAMSHDFYKAPDKSSPMSSSSSISSGSASPAPSVSPLGQVAFCGTAVDSCNGGGSPEGPPPPLWPPQPPRVDMPPLNAADQTPALRTFEDEKHHKLMRRHFRVQPNSYNPSYGMDRSIRVPHLIGFLKDAAKGEPDHKRIYEAARFYLEGHIGLLYSKDREGYTALYHAARVHRHEHIAGFIVECLMEAEEKCRQIGGKLYHVHEERYGPDQDNIMHCLAKWHTQEENYVLVAKTLLEANERLLGLCFEKNKRGELPRDLCRMADIRRMLDRR